jgi:integrase/recombinase XerD
MKKIKISRGVTLTFEESCNKYLENCRQRNLREGTIKHYKQSYTQFLRFFKGFIQMLDFLKKSDIMLLGCFVNSPSN